jgi:hypothetical protein
MKFLRSLVITASLLASSGVAYAQVFAVAPGVNRVRLSFTGVVTNDVTDTIMIRQSPNGPLVPYTGPKPDYPYKKGDALTISFTSDVPNKSYTGPGGPYNGQTAVGGIYKFDLRPSFGGGATGFGSVDAVQVAAGPIRGSTNASGPFMGGLSLIYDANADSYSLDIAQNGWAVGNYQAPFYQYDQTTNSLSSRSGCVEVSQLDCTLGSVSFTGDSASARYGRSDIGGAGIPIVIPNRDTTIGFLSDLLFSGSWNLPIRGSGGSTDVPEPGMFVLFAGGVAAMMRRRRRAKAA